MPRTSSPSIVPESPMRRLFIDLGLVLLLTALLGGALFAVTSPSDPQEVMGKISQTPENHDLAGLLVQLTDVEGVEEVEVIEDLPEWTRIRLRGERVPLKVVKTIVEETGARFVLSSFVRTPFSSTWSTRLLSSGLLATQLTLLAVFGFRWRRGEAGVPVVAQAEPWSWGRVFSFGLVGGLAISAFGWGWDQLALEAGFESQQLLAKAVESVGAPRALLWACVVVGAPVSEELFFRGNILRTFLPHSPKLGLFISSAVFAVFHFEPLFLVPLFVIGCVLGWVAMRTRSLLAPILAHAINNAIALASL